MKAGWNATFLCTNGKSGQDEGDKSGQRMREAGAADRGSPVLLSKLKSNLN